MPSVLLFLAELLKPRIIPERIEHRWSRSSAEVSGMFSASAPSLGIERSFSEAATLRAGFLIPVVQRRERGFRKGFPSHGIGPTQLAESVLLSLDFGVEDLKPLSAFLHPDAPTVIRTRHVLAFGILLYRRFVRNHGNVSAGEDNFHVGK